MPRVAQATPSYSDIGGMACPYMHRTHLLDSQCSLKAMFKIIKSRNKIRPTVYHDVQGEFPHPSERLYTYMCQISIYVAASCNRMSPCRLKIYTAGYIWMPVGTYLGTMYFYVYIVMINLSIAWTYCNDSNAVIICCTESVARDLQFVQHIHCAQEHSICTAELTSSFRAQWKVAWVCCSKFAVDIEVDSSWMLLCPLFDVWIACSFLFNLNP
jgi:hypothetical protein